ncbi:MULTISPECIES: PH domain-containing protein [unclassified Uliginosibacterium]|uniref:PH domain-containing protein n=1 Tax=unclassified Uliginosibacterium TaxID=2621521 RepID=UPI000C7B0E1A|nr:MULTISPECIES: PH domain-containing protein [unclassified Uliginosibacterium]MDO6387014.1 PH domain-containing protein [Uliginosibacterium sp. 31-12]PLK49688.1 helicase [Uliginosibacterium sp. TH139]
MGILSGLLGNAGVVPADKLAADYGRLLVEGESFEVGFVVLRDTFVFTNKRLILVNIQGLTGSKIDYLSMPYSKITKFSIETAGTFDLDAELKIWVGSDPMPIAKKFNKKVSIYDLQQVLAMHVLG